MIGLAAALVVLVIVGTIVFLIVMGWVAIITTARGGTKPRYAPTVTPGQVRSEQAAWDAKRAAERETKP